MRSNSVSSLSKVYTKCLGYIFLLAFLSYYVQFPQHGLLYLLVTAIYYFLVILGGQFYTFQWDILLIEAGFLTAVCFAPWQSLHLTMNDLNVNVGCWPLRFLLFKLMFMSGIVKIQAECPTWQNLTALEYHFATQCVSAYLRTECTLLCLHH